MSCPRILIVDDDVDFCQDVAALLDGRYETQMAYDVEAGLAAIERDRPEIVLLDLDFGAGRPGGLQVLSCLDGRELPPQVIVVSGTGRAPEIVEAVKRGAFHYLCKPPDPAELCDLLDLALAGAAARRLIRAQAADLARQHGDLVAVDPRSRAVLDQVARVAATDETVLITGESGTGKEVAARVIHRASRRRSAPFVVVNCAAIQPSLLESELFGHTRGAYTGAVSDEPGKFELARGGTLLLDEIGDVPPEVQAKLLRAIEYRVLDTVGARVPRPVDLRLLAATNQPLEAAMARGSFRRDLYYRLNVLRIHVPALRERPADVLPLARLFLRQYALEFGRPAEDFTPEAADALGRHDWPGNVRELKFAIARIVLRSRARLVGIHDLHPIAEAPELRLSYHEAKQQSEQRFQEAYCCHQLRLAGGNVTLAAELSGLPRQSFQRMLANLGIDPAAFRD